MYKIIKKTIIILICLLLTINIQAKQSTLRLDYFVAIHNQNVELSELRFINDGIWAGGNNCLNWADTAKTNGILLKVIDCKTNQLSYCKFYSTLWFEYLTFDKEMIVDTFLFESVRMLMPTSISNVVISMIDKKGTQKVLLTETFYPQSKNIVKPKQKYKVADILINGEIDQKIDLLFLPQGYYESESQKYLNNVKNITQALFNTEPYSQYKTSFNVRAVLPSEARNKLNFQYNTFGYDRYLGTYYYEQVCDVATHIPWEHVIILVNDKQYGGGGIYNFYTVIAGENKLANELFIHEFGHAFANLDDEYEPDTPYGAPAKPNNMCIMRTLSIKSFCTECNKNITQTIKVNTNEE